MRPGVADREGQSLLYRGAEADVFGGRWGPRPAVFKVRKPLPYRLPSLDATIRRQRTIHEAVMIHRAKAAGAGAPFLYFVDVPASTIVMERLPLRRMTDEVARADPRKVRSLFSRFGEGVAKLHGAGIMHGDLTTANVILDGRRLAFVDFGLSVTTTRVEDFAVDLRVTKETVTGAHPAVSVQALESFFEGYTTATGLPAARRVLSQLRSIERRGRYARVD
jgi:Kae1-associated kinase Bud32